MNETRSIKTLENKKESGSSTPLPERPLNKRHSDSGYNSASDESLPKSLDQKHSTKRNHTEISSDPERNTEGSDIKKVKLVAEQEVSKEKQAQRQQEIDALTTKIGEMRELYDLETKLAQEIIDKLSPKKEEQEGTVAVVKKVSDLDQFARPVGNAFAGLDAMIAARLLNARSSGSSGEPGILVKALRLYQQKCQKQLDLINQQHDPADQKVKTVDGLRKTLNDLESTKVNLLKDSISTAVDEHWNTKIRDATKAITGLPDDQSSVNKLVEGALQSLTKKSRDADKNDLFSLLQGSDTLESVAKKSGDSGSFFLGSQKKNDSIFGNHSSNNDAYQNKVDDRAYEAVYHYDAPVYQQQAVEAY